MVQLRLIFCLSTLTCFTYAAKLVNPKKCKAQRGCEWDWDCVLNSECRYIDEKQECGYCVCLPGYQPQGAQCKPIKGYSTTTLWPVTHRPTATTTTTTTTTTSTSTSTSTSTTTSPTTTTSTTTESTTTGTTTQSPTPPNPEPLHCSEYDCDTDRNIPSTDDHPFRVRLGQLNSDSSPGCKRQRFVQARPCNVQGGGACYGIYCLAVSPGNDYCICPPHRVDRQCAVDKPGACSSATGSPPSGYLQLQNTRLRNRNNRETGSIYARHFAASLYDCIKLCHWANGLCRSVNYGRINGASVCELMSIVATRKSLLSTWLENESGWQYVQMSRVS